MHQVSRASATPTTLSTSGCLSNPSTGTLQRTHQLARRQRHPLRVVARRGANDAAV